MHGRQFNVPFDPETAQDLGLLSERDLPEQAVANQQLGQQIEAQIAALPPDHRSAVQLVIVEQLSYAEAAEALDVPIGTLRSRLNRARARLCAALKVYLDDGDDHERPTKLRLVR